MSQEEVAEPTSRGGIAELSARWPYLIDVSGSMHAWRTQLRWGSVAADLVAVASACLAIVAIHNSGIPALGSPSTSLPSAWAGIVIGAAVVSVFYFSGLYEMESYVSRPLHLWLLLKASLVALAASSLLVYLARPNVLPKAYLVVPLTFAIFLVCAFTLRFGVIDGVYRACVRQHGAVSFVLGNSDAAHALADRLKSLRGFEDVEQAQPESLRLGMPEALGVMLKQRKATDKDVAAVFVDASSASPREVYETAAAAKTLGAEVYVVSRLLGVLEDHRVLSDLFEAPVIRVRRNIGSAQPYFLKRAVDIVGSAALLLACVPVLAVLGVVIRLTSPGPILYKQSRVGRFGRPFEFLKLRSMVLNKDASNHLEYVHAFMRNSAAAMPNGTHGDTVFKLVDDPRITPFGKLLRKYSLDEIPQFFNVLRGDMSLVGPRPPLPYEVSEYNEWHSLRLSVPSGITGLWQVAGRSRVTFDEMVLQDIMYAQNMRLLLDIRLCLMTVPAALLGNGGG